MNTANGPEYPVCDNCLEEGEDLGSNLLRVASNTPDCAVLRNPAPLGLNLGVPPARGG